ncbi:hypothetical protein EB796_004315 [Bugula neritina]|uniref:Ig-like domain-containing protein n=1 Tax=Bugula neritina TaxID=10212 RepID=A0A7J7KFF1_BUGNE|nr:hypothetical protein EB796_004315 [Bugula neritina]
MKYAITIMFMMASATTSTTTQQLNSNQTLVVAVEAEGFVLLPCQLPSSGDQLWIHWFKDEQCINCKNNSYQITRNGLKVKNVKKEAAGEYTCQIITEDNIKTKYITLRVDDKPPHADVDTGPLQWLINEDQENSQVVASPYGRATFTCYVRGEPSIHAEWFEDGVPIREGPSLRKTNTETYHNSSSNSGEPLMVPLQGGRNSLSSVSYADYEYPINNKWNIEPRSRLHIYFLIAIWLLTDLLSCITNFCLILLQTLKKYKWFIDITPATFTN